MRITEDASYKVDGKRGREMDFGLTVVSAADEEREEALDYCRDFFRDFVELAEPLH